LGRVLAAGGKAGAPVLVVGNGPHSNPEVNWLQLDLDHPQDSPVLEHCSGRLSCGYPMLNAVHLPGTTAEDDCFALGLRSIGDGVSSRREGVVSIWCGQSDNLQYPMIDFAGSVDDLAVSFAADAGAQPLLV